MLTHRGYTGRATVDFEDGLITGEVLGTQDVISFGGASVEEVEQSFRDAVDGYLAYCKEQGREPEKPYSGKFLLRMTPDQHRKLDEAARLAETSVNALILDRVFRPSEALPAQPQFTSVAALQRGGGYSKLTINGRVYDIAQGGVIPEPTVGCVLVRHVDKSAQFKSVGKRLDRQLKAQLARSQSSQGDAPEPSTSGVRTERSLRQIDLS